MLVDCSYIPSVNCSDENNTMKYYYNSTTQMCQQIITCDGPGNLFNFLEECNQECPGVYISTVSVYVFIRVCVVCVCSVCVFQDRNLSVMTKRSFFIKCACTCRHNYFEHNRLAKTSSIMPA